VQCVLSGGPYTVSSHARQVQVVPCLQPRDDGEGHPKHSHRTSPRQSQALSQAHTSVGGYTRESRPEGRSPGSESAKPKWGDRSGIESATTCQIAACSDSRQCHRRHRSSGRSGVRGRSGSACRRRPDDYGANRHLDHRPGSYGDVVRQPHDESDAAKRIRMKASAPKPHHRA
jgi:hypothetical protein